MANPYIARNIDSELLAWSKEPLRKPILLRGARQVGKTATVRNLAKSFKHYIEVNFEEQKTVHRIFEGDLSPDRLCQNLSIFYGKPIIEGKTLLFFDEIQCCLPAISALRFFYEKIPGLHVIAAGSLLEFALSEIPSFGVGRLRSIFMFPFSFDEFLIALNENLLLEAKNKASYLQILPFPIHEKLIDIFKLFVVIGGMPEVVSNYLKNRDLLKCKRILEDLIFSFRDDFSKYKKHISTSRILEVFDSIVNQSGNKFVYTKASPNSNHRQIKEVIEILKKAGLIHFVTHTSANGIPLGAERNEKKIKILIFDTGVFLKLLGLDISQILLSNEYELINKGAIAEIIVGLEIIKYSSFYGSTNLYYWHREALNSNAEIDYLIQKSDKIVPIEVKAGIKGSMKSLHLFIQEKKTAMACRFSLEPHSINGNIINYPLYAVSAFLKKH